MKQLSSLVITLAVAGLGFAAGGSIRLAEAGEAAAMPPRQLLLQQDVDLPTPNIKANVIRVTFPSGYKTPVHTHRGPGPRYVLKGRLRVEDGGQVHDYVPGDVFWETGKEMTVENVAGGDAELVIFEMVPR